MHLRLCPTQTIWHSSLEIISRICSATLRSKKHSGRNIMMAQTFQRAFSRSSLWFRTKIMNKHKTQSIVTQRRSPKRRKQRRYAGKRKINSKRSNSLKWMTSQASQVSVLVRSKKYKNILLMFLLTWYPQKCRKLKCSLTASSWKNGRILTSSWGPN